MAPNAKTEPAKRLLRLPRGLDEQLKAAADAQGVSVNTLMVIALSNWIGWTLEPDQTK